MLRGKPQKRKENNNVTSVTDALMFYQDFQPHSKRASWLVCARELPEGSPIKHRCRNDIYKIKINEDAITDSWKNGHLIVIFISGFLILVSAFGGASFGRI
jgi:hypothetical protein